MAKKKKATDKKPKMSMRLRRKTGASNASPKPTEQSGAIQNTQKVTKSPGPIPQPTSKRKGRKRKLFNAENPDIEIKRAKLYPKFNLSSIIIVPPPMFWRCLQDRGPFTIRNFLTPAIVQNRPLYHFALFLSEHVYSNFEHFQKEHLCNIGTPTRAPSVNMLMQRLETMCSETMKYSSDQLFVIFDLKSLLASVRRLIAGKKKVTVDSDSSAGFLQQLELICNDRKIKFSKLEIMQLRNVFLEFFGNIQLDFMNSIVAFDENGIPKEHIELALPPSDMYIHDSQIHALTSLHSHPKFIKNELTHEATLWTLIPYETKRYLLGHVVTDGLSRYLPPNVLNFLNDWMILVQKRMRKRLKSGDLKRVADSVTKKKKSLKVVSSLIGRFLQKLVDNVLNCKENFKVFDQKWQTWFLKSMKKSIERNHLMKGHYISLKLFRRSNFEHLDSLFSDSNAHKHLLKHLKAQLHYFFVQFCCHTISLVFNFNTKSGKLDYCINLEDDETTDFEKIDRIEETLEKENSRSQDPFPVEIPKVQVLKPRKTLLPSPVIPQPTVPPRTFDVSQQYLIPTNVPLSNYAVYPQNYQEYYFNPIPPTPLVVHPPKIERTPKTEPLEPNLSAEVTEEELKSARALRTPSEVSGGLSGKMDEDEEIPKKWRDAYRLLMEWNHDLKDELKNVKERYEKFN